MSAVILEHIKNLCNHLPSFNLGSRRKRRQEELPERQPPQLTKYRRVNNNFPAFRTPFEDEMERKNRHSMVNGGFSASQSRSKDPDFITNPEPSQNNYGVVEFSDTDDDFEVPAPPRQRQSRNSFNFKENSRPSTSKMSRVNGIDFALPGTSNTTSNSRSSRNLNIPELIKVTSSTAPFIFANGHHFDSSTQRSSTAELHKNPFKSSLPQSRPSFGQNILARARKTANSLLDYNINLIGKKNYDHYLEHAVLQNNYGIGLPKPQPTKYLGTITLDDDETPVRPKPKENQKEKFKKPSPIIDLSDDDSDQLYLSARRTSFPFSRRSSLLSSTMIDGEKRATSDTEISQKASSTSQNTSKQSEANDSKKLPDIEPVNSLKDRLTSRPFYQTNYDANLRKRYETESQRRKELIALEEQQHRELNKSTKEQESILSEKFKDFFISPDIVVLDEEEEEEYDEYPDLTKEMIDKINRSVRGGPMHETIVNKFNMNITRQDLSTLLGDNWLNDEVINFYMNLLMERSEQGKEDGRPSVYAMNTFFIPKLLQGGHASLRRWTRKVDIFQYDIIPVPVHVGQVHWCMAIIHLKNKTIKYYDSMGHANFMVLDALESYLKDESMDKKKQPFDMTGWSKECVKDCPRQMNGSDCGVFSCMFAEFICRNSKISFDQKHMQYFRSKMIYEIATGKLILQ